MEPGWWDDHRVRVLQARILCLLFEHREGIPSSQLAEAYGLCFREPLPRDAKDDRGAKIELRDLFWFHPDVVYERGADGSPIFYHRAHRNVVLDAAHVVLLELLQVLAHASAPLASNELPKVYAEAYKKPLSCGVALRTLLRWHPHVRATPGRGGAFAYELRRD
jgi:hypothetical protein